MRVVVPAAVLAAAGCATVPDGLAEADVIASANEPFFQVQVTGGVATIRTVDADEVRIPVTVREARPDGGARIEARGAGRAATVELAARACEDSMSAARFPLTARISIDGVTNDGCARRASDPVPSIPGE